MTRIGIDAGHGGEKEEFRKGPSGLYEEDINLAVAKALQSLLVEDGHEVLLSREDDRKITIAERVEIFSKATCDLVVSIHHNSTQPANPRIDYPLVFIHGFMEDSTREFQLGRMLAAEFQSARKKDCAIFSDYFLFEQGLGLLRGLKNCSIPAVLGEFSFFSHPHEEKNLGNPDYIHAEAKAYFTTIKNSLSLYPPLTEVNPVNHLWPKEHPHSLMISRREKILNHQLIYPWELIPVFQKSIEEDRLAESYEMMLDILALSIWSPGPHLFKLRDIYRNYSLDLRCTFSLWQEFFVRAFR